MIALIIGAIGIVFIFTFGYGGLKSGALREVASVNGEPILLSAYQRQYNEMIRQYQERSHGELTEDMIKALRLKEMALRRLIEESLILQTAKRQGSLVSDAELREEIRQLPYFQRDGKFDEQIYYAVLARNHLSAADFEELERRRLEMRKVIDGLTSLAKVSDAELLEMFHLGKDAVKVSYIVISPDKFMAKQKASDADISQYYQNNQAAFQLPPRAKVSYFLFRFKDFHDQAKIAPSQVEAFIKEHQSEFSRAKVIKARQIMLALPSGADAAKKESLSKQAQDLLQKLQKGEDFAQLAKSHSQDPATRDKGGELGYFQRGQHPAEWDQVAFAVPAGRVGRVDTPQAIYLIKVEEVKETEKLPDAEAKATGMLKQQQARNLAQEAAREARTALSQGTTAEVAKKYQVNSVETPLLGLKDRVPGLGAVPAFNQTALQLKVGEVSRVVNLPDGLLVMKSLEYQAEHVPPLEKIKDQVSQQVKKQAALKEADKEAVQLLARLKKGETLSQVAAAANTPVKESKLFTRFEGFDGKPTAEALTSAAFTLSKEHPYSDQPIFWQDNYYLLGFKERRPASQAEFEKDKDKMKAQFLEQKKQMMLQSWLTGEQQRAKIKVYELP
ncbi:MAG: SurA N-terminal domain-containing protein [Deltaproteobacteria bacterium]|nr:SurA N-terminal domain-containing protein [Deltaproteobacteria bacterium]